MEEEEEENKYSTLNNSFLHQGQEDSITEGKLLNMAANSKPLSEDNTTEVKGEPSVSVQGEEHDEAVDQEIHTADTEIKTELSDIRVYSPVSAPTGTDDCGRDIESPSILEPVPPKDEDCDVVELELVQDSLSGVAGPSISAVDHDGVSVEDDGIPIELKLEESPRSPKFDDKTPELDHAKDDEEATPSEVKLDEEEVFFNTQKEEETLADLGEKNHMEEEQISTVEKESMAKMDDTNMLKEEEDVLACPQIEEETRAEQKLEEEDTESEDVGKESGDDSTVLGGDEDEDEDEAVAAEEEAETALETETDGVELGKESGGEKRKRGKNPKGTAKVTTGTRKKIAEEDVCFICFDGGELVLCDRRGCPKAYHPTCVNRDEAFFKAKGRWNCGWHQCSICEKNAQYMCYTCTYSLCKGCIKDAVILCVRGNKGFCESCMKTVMLIENEDQGDKEVDFTDKSSWEYLFKDYWLELKAKLSLTVTEISSAKKPKKGSDTKVGKQGSHSYDVNSVRIADSASEKLSENLEGQKAKKGKGKKLSKSPREQSIMRRRRINKGASTSIHSEWASNELLEFVMHMRSGDKSPLSQFDVQAMLLEYIKKNKLRDPHRKSQIICDGRLQSLFGKLRVGHFEMLKLLESHFLLKEDSQMDDIQDNAADTDTNMLEADTSADTTKRSKEKKHKNRKKGGGRQSNVEDYAAIDSHNISLIYLRRKLAEDLLEDTESFNEKVVGTFVRIRIPGNNLKQDIYRLVQVVGTSKSASPYKVSKKTTDFMLEILNLDKNEVVSIDSISNQEFTEDECKRLRQSIKCGLINRLTVGDILDKAMETQAARVNDWIETETVRLSHLRDRASEKGRIKEHRECVEKLQVLKTPEERRRRLEETTEIHADPKMDPAYESEDNDTEMEEDAKQDVYAKPRGSFSRRPIEPISPGRGGPEISPKDAWGGGNRKSSVKNWEINRNLQNRNIPIKPEDSTTSNFDNENSWSQRREKEVQRETNNVEIFGYNNSHSAGTSDTSSLPPANLSTPPVQPAIKFSETDKLWHYKDPSGKGQGPFSMSQLRKWNSTGYFPADLKIWRAGKEAHFVLLANALEGKFPPEPTPPAAPGEDRISTSNGIHHQLDLGSSRARNVEIIPKVSVDSMDISSNFPSPTPKQNSFSAGGMLKSPTPADNTQPLLSNRNTESIPATQMYSHPVPAPETAQANMVQTVNQGLVQNSTMSMPAQQAYAAQWGGVVPQPNPAAAAWGVGPDMNAGWMPMPPSNPNMGWVGPVPTANTNMNWAPANPGWVVPQPQLQLQPQLQPVGPGNWVTAQPPNSQPWGAAPQNGNIGGWGPVNPVIPNPNQGWVGGGVPTSGTNNNNNGYQGPVTSENANQKWGSGDGYSGRRDNNKNNNRNWNRQPGHGSGR